MRLGKSMEKPYRSHTEIARTLLTALQWVMLGDEATPDPDAMAEIMKALAETEARFRPLVEAGWKEATIAWSVCASIHREYGKRRDALYTTRQADFLKHETDARAALAELEEGNK